MILEIHVPGFPLSNFIESFVYYRDYSPAHTVDRFLPDGNVNVVIDLTDYPKFIYDNHTLKEIQACKKVWFSGIRNGFITIPSGRDSEMFILNFHKGRSYPFVEMPLHELTDYVVDGELVMPNAIMDIREALLNTASIPQKFAVAEQMLLQVYRGRLNINPFIDFAVSRILQKPDQTAIHKLTAKVGYSQKHLIKIFKEHVGVTPKAFLKIIRFQKAITEIGNRQSTSWTSVALESGYYDQSHFINDFKHFSGFTPNQFLAMNSEFTNYVAVG
jgi:AraC-like DNA-binding protein